MLGLLHQFLEDQMWDEKDELRAKQLLQSNIKSLPKSLERNTGDLIMGAMFGPTRYPPPPRQDRHRYHTLGEPLQLEN